MTLLHHSQGILLRTARWIAIATIPAMVSAPATSQEKQIIVSATTQFDDNLLRVSDGAKASLPHNGREIVSLLSVGGVYQAELGSLTMGLSGSAAQRLFAYNDQLNSREFQLSSRLKYTALSGSAEVAGAYSHQNSSFNDPLFRGVNVQDLTSLKFRGDRRLIGDIRIAGRAGFSANSNSNDNVSRADNHRYSFSVGLKYVSPIENSFELGFEQSTARGSGDRLVLINNVASPYQADAVDKTVFGEVLWSPNEIWSLQSRVGYTWHNDQSVLDTDFNGLTTDASLKWSPAAATTLSFSASRSFSSNNEVFSNGVKLTAYSGQITTALFDNVALNGSVKHADRDFRYDLQASDPAAVSRRETFWVYSAGTAVDAGWGAKLGLQFNHIRINSDLNGFHATDNAISLSLSRPFSF
ncbi:MAG: outer membrane beta-barrel protein [Sphingobium sp.]